MTLISFIQTLIISLITIILTSLHSLIHFLASPAHSSSSSYSAPPMNDFGQYQLRQKLESAYNYIEWRDLARQLDHIIGNDDWKNDPKSSEYDHILIFNRLTKLRDDRIAQDAIELMYSLRSGLLRNLGGISDTRLYCTCYVGYCLDLAFFIYYPLLVKFISFSWSSTKRLIQEYTVEVINSLKYIAEGDHELPLQARLDFFQETKQSFGASALILEGLYHLGVVLSLHGQQLLPRVISGSAVGALIAALVCIHTDNEIQSVLRPGGINLSAFQKQGEQGTLSRKLVRWLKYGHILDVKVLEDCVRANVGDLTFEEAYKKTRRILNITVSSERYNEVPKVLNYLTAPNVLIWSAACASTTATYPLYSQVHLLAKDNLGLITKWSPADITWTKSSNVRQQLCDAKNRAWYTFLFPHLSRTEYHANQRKQMDDALPHHRLAELFNVNHLIVSQAGALAVPMVIRGWREHHSFATRIVSAILMEFRHRTNQAAAIGVVPRVLARWIAPETITGDVTITPELRLNDYRNLFSNPTSDVIEYWIHKGEKSTWPLMSLIKNRCAVEFALDRHNHDLRILRKHDSVGV